MLNKVKIKVQLLTRFGIYELKVKMIDEKVLILYFMIDFSATLYTDPKLLKHQGLNLPIPSIFPTLLALFFG